MRSTPRGCPTARRFSFPPGEVFGGWLSPAEARPRDCLSSARTVSCRWFRAPTRPAVSSGLRSQFPRTSISGASKPLLPARRPRRRPSSRSPRPETTACPSFRPTAAAWPLSPIARETSEIWLADPDGSNAVQLTVDGRSTIGAPCWSPDGERIVFHSNPEGQWDVYVIPAAGGKPRNLTSHPASDAFPSFSRDRQWIYFNSNRTGELRIWKIPASGGDAVQVTNSVGFAPFESPDGACLYYMRDPGQAEPVVAPAGLRRCSRQGAGRSCSRRLRVLEGGIYYIDRPSGEGGFSYLDQPSGETRLQYFDFATRRSTTVARDLGNVDLRPHRLSGRPHDSLFPGGLLRGRPDAGGRLPVVALTMATPRIYGLFVFSRTNVRETFMAQGRI